MRKIKEILRLKHEVGLSHRGIQQSLNIGYGTVVEYLKRAQRAGLNWPLPADMDERTLGRLLYPSRGGSGHRRFVEPDHIWINQELKRPGVTKQLLWQEYRQQHPETGYSYAQFCHRYSVWLSRQKWSMRQHHRAGEKLFVDYCGPVMPIHNADTGEVRYAQIFVAALGASSYTYAEAIWSQNQQDWINAHVRTFAFLGGVPEIVVPDNLKSAVRKTHGYEPDINPIYQQMAAHYQVAIIPARPYKPKDKAKVEVAVQIVERWILARLRHHTFFTLADLNRAIRALLVELNHRPFKQLPGSRQTQFEQLDQPQLKPLPAKPFEYAEIRQASVYVDYHVEFERHYYSVPHALIKQTVQLQASAHSVLIYAHGQRVASHVRSDQPGGHTTCVEHMPAPHRAMTEWSADRLLARAEEIGVETREVVKQLLAEKRHEQQRYRRVLALLANARTYGPVRLNNACGRALLINSPTRTSIESILKQGLDQQTIDADACAEESALDHHENVRGEGYYH
ncbi:MAG: IS21 family transposase [Pseudohongiellaceae bacterium]